MSNVEAVIKEMSDYFNKPDVLKRLRANPHFHKFVIAILLSGGGVFALYKSWKKFSTKKKSDEESLKKLQAHLDEQRTNAPKKKRPQVDALFFKRLWAILKIIMPGVKTKEFEYFVIFSILLVARTYLTVEIAELLGTNAQFMVAKQYKQLLWGILKFAAITIPASGVNSAIKYFTNMLSLRFRIRLSHYVMNEYLSGVNFYKAIHLGGANKIDNADQRVTADISNFSSAISELYSATFKPLLDVLLFTYQLSKVTGWQGPAIMYGYFVLSGVIKRNIMPSFGKFVARESELEGYYRTAHQRIITNSEEIAFYDGSKKEAQIIREALNAIENHISYFEYLKSLVGVFDGLLVKYWASIAGYLVLSAPQIWNFGDSRNKSVEVLTRDYIRNSQYLSKLTNAVGDLVLIGNKITNIAGYTSRVWELLEMIKHLNTVGNRPFEIRVEKPISKEDFKEVAGTSQFIKEWKQRCDERPEPPKSLNQVKEVIGGGKIIEGKIIKFEGVDIVSPEGKLLVKNLNCEVSPGVNVMVTGPNGAGKSSLFRLIGELWPLHCGTLTKPRKEHILFVPQKPYLVLGTLRDQIIYPHSKADMERLGVKDEDLARLLEIVDPNKNITKEWTWDTEKDWFHAFSGGQKQRVAMARLFYHRPKFAILDECTSAVSDEVEDKIYETCKELGITIFTVSHRKSLQRHHDYILRFNGDANATYSWIQIKKEDKYESLSKEEKKGDVKVEMKEKGVGIKVDMKQKKK